MLIISGEFTVKPEHRDILIDMSQSLVPKSVQESGCISYDFYESKVHPGQFLFFERWQSQHDVDKHFGMPYFKKFVATFPELIEGDATIEIHDVTSTKRL